MTLQILTWKVDKVRKANRRALIPYDNSNNHSKTMDVNARSWTWSKEWRKNTAQTNISHTGLGMERATGKDGDYLLPARYLCAVSTVTMSLTLVFRTFKNKFKKKTLAFISGSRAVIFPDIHLQQNNSN